MAAFESIIASAGELTMLTRVAIFIVVQALVYLILSKSSTIFSENRAMRSVNSFKTVRSVSIRRILAALADMPAGGEPSPSSNDLDKSPYQDDPTVEHHHHTS